MGLSAIARRILGLGAIATFASVMAFGVGAQGAGAAWLAPAGAATSVPSNPFLTGVSCPATSMCMIVGGDDNGPLAATWNGQTWRWMARPPEPKADSDLGAVTCLSATRCIAVGNSDAGDGIFGRGVAFGDEWDGRTWHAMPPMAGVTFNRAFGLSCVSAAYCIAVGGSDQRGELGNAIAELWNGTSWTKMTPVIPAGVRRIAFDDVACTSTSNCLAVGSYQIGALDVFGLAESWNGSKWTRLPAIRGMIYDLVGVSCPRADLCLADGVAGHRGFRPAAAVWNGRTWRRLTTPRTDGISSLTGVSCTSATRCMTVGGDLAEVWTGGTSLRRLPIPIPSPPAGLPGVAPYGVSCPNSSRCLAVGSPIITGFDFIGGDDSAIGWNGTKWHGIRQSKADSLEAVSCVTSSDC